MSDVSIDSWAAPEHATPPRGAAQPLTDRGATASLQTVRPMWLDIDNCGDSEYTVPPGESSATWDWTVRFPARVVFAAGHQHDYGVHINSQNLTTGKLICDSYASYGTDPSYMGHLSKMGTCSGSNLALLHTGDRIRLTSVYNAPETRSDVMGIMLLYVRPLA